MKNAQPLDLALIGNCRVAALVDPQARIVWWCFPRFDGDPVFSRLLAGDEEKGFCDVVMHGRASCRSAYARNTAVLETFLEDEHGGIVKITDFMPRFGRYERVFRPPQLVRRIEPVAGLPRVAIRVRPTFNYGQKPAQVVIGSNHIRYIGDRDVLRLTSDAPLSFIQGETMFALTRPVTLVFGVDEPFLSDIDSTAKDFETRPRAYWLEWSRTLGVPFEWQSETIRSAITLKLCSFEETGAIIAAHTTSVPEAPGTMRNWDYRFCWLRDAFFVVAALNRLGATQTMESYINYLTTAVADPDGMLSPLHSIVPGEPLDEHVAADLQGYRGQGPVRIGNAAAEQAQHDVYGSVVLGAKQMFVDHRLPKMGDEALFRRLEQLGERAAALALTPDAGIWEYRGRQRIHTHSVAMCWAGCNRLAAIAGQLGHAESAAHWNAVADRLHATMMERAWNESRSAFTASFGGEDLDASVLLLHELGAIDADDPRFVSTVKATERELVRGNHVLRYASPDDFGVPEGEFLICRFWLIDAWWALGRKQDARDLFADAMRYRNRYGLLAEHVHIQTGALWGNFPQTYSMVGLIVAAMRLSTSWEKAR